LITANKFSSSDLCADTQFKREPLQRGR